MTESGISLPKFESEPKKNIKNVEDSGGRRLASPKAATPRQSILGIRVRRSAGDVLRRIADDREVPDDGIDGHLACVELLKGQIGGDIADVASGLKDVVEIDERITLPERPRSESVRVVAA